MGHTQQEVAMASTPGTQRNSPVIAAVSAMVVLCWLSPAQAAPISIPINCHGSLVGSIDVDISTVKDGAKTLDGVVGGFNTVNGPGPIARKTLAETAKFCDEDHFNWYQIIQFDSTMPEVGPYVDPPHGGYPNQWADDLDWYWDEKMPAPPLPANFDARYQLSNRTHMFTLDYFDFPIPPVGEDLDIITYLVSLDVNGKLVDYHSGFEFYLSRTDANTTKIPELFVYITPEPGTMSLFALGCLSVIGWRYRVRRSNP
jgi:hypothetical protein